MNDASVTLAEHMAENVGKFLDACFVNNGNRNPQPMRLRLHREGFLLRAPAAPRQRQYDVIKLLPVMAATGSGHQQVK